MLIMHGPFWTRDSQIAYSHHELHGILLPALIPILDRFGIRKTPRTKDHVIERILQELIRDHDPWCIRSQQYWRSNEPLFWPLGRGPREDMFNDTEIFMVLSASGAEPDRADIESVMPSDSVSQIGSPAGHHRRLAGIQNSPLLSTGMCARASRFQSSTGVLHHALALP